MVSPSLSARSLPFDPDRTYSQTQFARGLGKSTKTVLRWRIHGVVSKRKPHIRVWPAFFVAGGTWSITGQAANEFIAALTPADVRDDAPATPPPRRRSATQERLEAYGF